MEVTLSQSAVEDLHAIQDYYADEGVPEVGVRFIAEIFEHVDKLSSHPDMGRVVPEFGEEHIRELIHPPFRVVYFRENTSVQIIRVWRSERLLDLDNT